MRRLVIVFATILWIAFSALSGATSAAAASCGVQVSAKTNTFLGHTTCIPSTSSSATNAVHRSGPRNPGYLGNGVCVTVLVSACDALPAGSGLVAQLLGGGTVPDAVAALPQVTGGQVLEAFRRIPLPSSRSVAQPDDKTLVNFDTIFYTHAAAFRRTFALLGRQITLAIRPAQYTWTFGDGQSMTTDQPGAPYPDKSVVHRYAEAHVTVDHHVTVIWAARFRVDGGPWRDVPGNAYTDGPGTDLRVAEATPVLTGDY